MEDSSVCRHENNHKIPSVLPKPFPDIADDLFIDPAVEEQGNAQGHDLGDREGPPDVLHLSGQGKQIGRGEQHHKLSRHGHAEAVNAVSERLEQAADHDAEAREEEA